jgi:hypothetical protein
MAMIYRHFGIAYRRHLQRSSIPRKISSWTILLIGIPETSVTSHRPTLRKISEERNPQIHRVGIVVVDVVVFSCHLFFLALLLKQRLPPPLRLQVSHCSTFRIMCDFPSIAVCCSESIECFPGIA